jgi:DNA-binding transcriptional MerR regulator
VTHQIGEVAQTVGLSLRTIRYYDEVGIVVPSGRSAAGYRLYTDQDIERLLLVRDMKPLEFSLDEIREIVTTLDTITRGDSPSPKLQTRLTLYATNGEERCDELREQLRAAQRIVETLRTQSAQSAQSEVPRSD